MSSNMLLTILTIAAMFGLLAALWLAGVFIYGMRLRARGKALESRLGLLIPGDTATRVLRLWHEGHFEETIVGTGKSRGSVMARLRRMHHEAGIEADPATSLMMVVVIALVAGLAFFMLLKNPMLALGAPAVVVIGYFWVLGFKVRKRANIFDNQIISALDLVARSLRAGHPLLASFHLITDELDDPIRGIFAEILQQHQMGVTLEESIQRVAAQSTNADLKLFATAIAIQLRSGGNLAEVMVRLSYVVRERVRLGRRVKVLTAQTNMSKNVLLAFPIVMFLMLNVVDPEYGMALVHSSLGNKLLVAGGVMMVFGAFVMTKMAKLKY